MRSYRNILFYLSAVVLILSLTLNNAEAKKTRVALLDIKAKNTSATYGDVVGDILEVALYKTESFDLLERNRVSAILKEQGFQQSGCSDETCAVEVGKLLSAELVILGSIIKLGKFTITIKLIDMKEGRVIVADSEFAETEADIQTAVDKIAGRLAEKMKAVTGREDMSKKKEPSVISRVGYFTRGIIPGWGQIYAGNNLKGFAYMGCFLLTVTAGAAGYKYYDIKKQDYKDLPKNESKATYDKKYNDYKTATNIAVYSAGLFALSYIASWVDLVFFTKPEYGKVIGAVKYDNSYVDINLYSGYSAYQEGGLTLSCGMRF